MEKIICSVCGCELQPGSVMTEVQVELSAKYYGETGSVEDMNGLWRKTRELLCKSCFTAYAQTLEHFYQAHIKTPEAVSPTEAG